MQLIVLGSHRSGTSLITRLINMMGVYFAPEGKSIGFNDENPKGFWERRDVISLNDALLRLNRCSWDNLSHWHEHQLAPLTEELAHSMKNLILEMDSKRPWVIKDPRLCITFPYWRPFLEVPVTIISYRSPVEVANSLRKRNGFSLAHGLSLWEYHTAGSLNHTLGLPRVFVQYAHFLTDPVGATKILYDQLVAAGVQGLRLPHDPEITAFVSKDLQRSRLPQLSEEETLLPSQLALIDYATGKCSQRQPLPLSAIAKEMMKDYDTYLSDIEQHLQNAGKLRAYLELEEKRFQLMKALTQLHIQHHQINELALIVKIRTIQTMNDQLSLLYTQRWSFKIKHRVKALILRFIRLFMQV